MVWFATAEEKSTRSEPETSKLNRIIIDILNSLNASNVGSFITFSLQLPRVGFAACRKSIEQKGEKDEG